MKIFKMFPSLLVFLSVSYCPVSEARLAMFSRANCWVPGVDIGDESISYDLIAQHRLRTFSYHYQRGILKHSINTPWATTRRSAATHHDPISQSLWYVAGKHYEYTAAKGTTFVNTSASNCNLSEF